jgi:hypothetical protein
LKTTLCLNGSPISTVSMYPREYFDTFWRPDLRDEVFVAMAFDPAFDDIWEGILKPAVAQIGMAANRVDATVISGNILTDIMDGIAQARLILVELTALQCGHPNDNVMYELGLAHALRQASEVLLIRSDTEKILFDVSPIRIHTYHRSDPAKARSQIAGWVRNSLAEVNSIKSLKVQLAVEALDDTCLSLMKACADTDWFYLSQDQTMDGILSSIPNRLATSRMLELGLLQCRVDHDGSTYAYFWTSFANAVMRRIGYRK